MTSIDIGTEGSHIDFERFIEDFFLPQLKTFQMTKASVSNATGDKADIKRDKHGFYSVKYTFVKEQM